MSLSPFFHHLRSAYQAELDDLTSDSEGSNILAKKLAERRKELKFLLSMLELSPEMVAVVFHQGFRFKRPAVMEELVRQESEDLPEWDSLADAVELAPWAHTLAQQVLQQPAGAWFMSVAAALEYLLNKPDARFAAADESDDEEDDRDDIERDPEGMDEDERQSRVNEEEGAAWMVEQGFDHKE
ncbi:hypothetical protein MCEMSHM24_02678 [Comamonadaceae bacterium]|jgi:hypothetical protein|uniref:hypothetical protein n=1 Tax=Rhodoferax potami TaxID=3068338 RepID=UPI0028BDF3F0|nr:hypothetical protein [Rhodoferax sp. TBRC 17198]MDT7522123.1 hypothetical protein [Rhodoferax sp. TBRC 17198]